MPDQPQLVIEVYTDDEGQSRIIIRTNADAATTVAPASVSAAVPAAPKKRARRKATQDTHEDQDASEAATATAPKNGRRKKKATKKKAATKKAATKKAATKKAAAKKKATKKKATKKRGRQPLPDKQMLQASEGDSTAELFRLDKKWYLNINGEPANEGNGWISRKQALAHATEVMGEVEVVE